MKSQRERDQWRGNSATDLQFWRQFGVVVCSRYRHLRHESLTRAQSATETAEPELREAVQRSSE
jgi:hypothetical protein